MTVKIDAAIVKIILEGNFMTIPRIKALIQLSKKTDNRYLKTRLEDFLEVIEYGNTRFYSTYDEWKDSLMTRKDSLIRFADLALDDVIT